MALISIALLLSLLYLGGHAKCYEPSPAFPVPLWPSGREALYSGFVAIDTKLKDLIKAREYDASSFSIEITSNTDTLWSRSHTARERNKTRPGVDRVDADSLYRIASITKTFTVLGILYQHAAGNMSLDDPISNYIWELNGPDAGALPWKHITLRILASQLSGIPRELAQADLINEFPDPTVIGLPPATKEGVPRCGEYDGHKACHRSDLVNQLKHAKPLFAPNQKSTYSNVAFELLGLALENVTGVDYSSYIKAAIFEPLDMASTSLEKPSDRYAVLPKGDNYWDVEEGVQRPTGGIYSTSSDMTKYVRYILTHFNALATGVNWMMPASWATGMQTMYGMPWEIFRTDRILKGSRRPVTFVTKGGALPGYYSHIAIMPEYGLGITILVGGRNELVREIGDIIAVELTQAADSAVWADVEKAYTGSFVSTNASLNSSIELASSSSTGLMLNSFISNGTDVLNTILPAYSDPDIASGKQPWHAQLVPTLLFKNESAQQGEVWRMIVTPERVKGSERGVFDEFCMTDVDQASYAGLPVNEVVFWHEEGVVELPAWRLKMKATPGKTGEQLVVQY